MLPWWIARNGGPPERPVEGRSMVEGVSDHGTRRLSRSDEGSGLGGPDRSGPRRAPGRDGDVRVMASVQPRSANSRARRIEAGRSELRGVNRVARGEKSPQPSGFVVLVFEMWIADVDRAHSGGSSLRHGRRDQKPRWTLGSSMVHGYADPVEFELLLGGSSDLRGAGV